MRDGDRQYEVESDPSEAVDEGQQRDGEEERIETLAQVVAALFADWDAIE